MGGRGLEVAMTPAESYDHVPKSLHSLMELRYIGSRERGMMEEIEEMVCSPPEGGVFSSTAVLFGPEPLLLARTTDTEYAVSTFRPVTSPLWREEEERIPRDWHEECQDSQLWCHCSPPSPYHSPVPLSPPRLSHTHSPVQVH